jgi:hypothetical protein
MSMLGNVCYKVDEPMAHVTSGNKNKYDFYVSTYHAKSCFQMSTKVIASPEHEPNIYLLPMRQKQN